MGKLATNLLTIGAAVGFSLTGVGSIIAGGLVSTLGGSFAAAAVASTVVGGIQIGLTMAALSSAASLLGLGPSAPKSETRETAIKTERPPRVSAYGESKMFGAYILYETASDGSAVDVFAIHDGEIDTIIGFYLNDFPVALTGNTVNAGADGRYSNGAVSLYWTDGTAPGAGIPAISALVPQWQGRGDGVVLLGMIARSVKADDFIKVYPNNVPVASMAARWQRCPDPWAMDPTDETGWTWTENVIRHLMHYRMVREGIDFQTKIAPSLVWWRAAASICDEPVPLKSGGWEPRWRSAISHKHTEPHANVISALLSACDGWIATAPDGSYRVYAGKYYVPTVTIGEDQIIAFDWDGVGVDDDQAVNEITCAYVSKIHAYSTVDTDPWTDEIDIANRGAVLTDGLDPQVPSHGQVRRLAKRKMIRQNALHRGTVTTNVAGRSVIGERYIRLRLIEAGTVWFDGPAEILSLTRNLATGGVTFSWVAADPNIDAWNPATEEGSPAPNGERVAPEPLDAPVITDVAVEIVEGETSARARLTITGPDRADLTWFARWRVSTDVGWNEQQYGDDDPGAGVLIVTPLLPINVNIDLAAAYSVGDGRLSPWSAVETVSTSTLALAPGPVTDVFASGGDGGATLSWRNPTSSNLAYVRVYRATSDAFSAATNISGDIAAPLGALGEYSDMVVAGTYWYWLVTVSAADVEGSPVLAGEVIVT